MSTQRVVLITGCNRGIGLELCKQYAMRGDYVIATCRKASEELLKLKSYKNLEVFDDIDVTDQQSLVSLASRLHERPIDILINNAGIISREGLADMNFDSLRANLETNSIAPLRVTHALLQNLHANSKICMLSSLLGSIAENTVGGKYAYRMSKAALNMAGKSLAEDLKSRGIQVAMIHPGHVKTDMAVCYHNSLMYSVLYCV